MKNFTFIAAVLLISTAAFAGENDQAQAAFCKYTMEQAEAQRDLLRTPSATVGPIQPSTGTAPQMVFGVIGSIADIKKASLTMKAAHTGCELYTAATEAQMHIFFALPGIEKDVLRHRLALIQAASEKLDGMIHEDSKLVAAQNLTRPAVYYLAGARVRLDMSRTAALTGITSPYVPPLSDVPLKTLIGDKLQAEESNQKALTRLQKQSGWDIQLSGGAHRQLNNVTPTTSATGAYGTFSLTYNLGRRKAEQHMDNSVSAYTEWKSSQFDDVAHQAVILKKQIEDTISIQQEQLRVLQDHDIDIVKDLTSMDGVETSNALSFKNQLLADQTILRVDIGDIQFRIALLQQYLSTNF